ncbi:O-antigen ligase family protein [Candidatus Parcubacteria bacterium]|nr:O-antigen ligase family protein [Candidatus Parcubacteria bacterium]
MIQPRVLLFSLLVVLALLTSLGLVPRETLLIWTGLAAFLILCSPLENGLWLFLASMPILPALPLGRSDSLNAFVFLIPLLMWRAWLERRNAPGPFWPIPPTLRLLMLGAGALLGLMALSALGAPDRALAFQRLLFFALSFGFAGVVYAHLAREGPPHLIHNALIAATAIVISGGFLQLILVKFLGLNTFWSTWALGAIPILFGDSLSQVLLIANSWFAFLPGQPATLRMFSIFPDSHSFAMWLILSLALTLPLVVMRNTSRRGRVAAAALVVLTLLGIILSGSRGTWISALVPLVTAVIFLIAPVRRRFGAFSERIPKRLAATAAITIFVFLTLFPVATTLVRWSAGRMVTDQVLYERALTIADVAEVSNQGRLRIWKLTLRSIGAQPLLGVGLNNYPVVLAQEPRESKKGSSAHNLYLHLAAELGVPALLLVVILGALTLLSALRRDETPSAYSGLFAFAFLWAAGYSMFDVVLLQNRVWLFLLTLTVLALRRNHKPPSSGSQPAGLPSM